MHISEGILSTPVLISGAVLATAGIAVGLKKLDYERIPHVAILSAAFFVASLIHVPIGPSSVHLVLNGLMGLFLGWVVFPAILIGLILQAILFQFGGLTTLGVNTVLMGLPAFICFLAFGAGVKSNRPAISMISAFLCGFGAVFIGSLMVAMALIFTGRPFLPVAKVIVIAQLPVMIIEGLITVFCVKFLKRVKPEILEVVYAP
jgi:cobalt/nickel transport system permease protein